MAEERNIIRAGAFVLVAIFLTLLGQLFNLQILQGKENRRLADENRIAKVKLDAPRGLILDRHGEVLAQNEPVYTLKRRIVSRDEALSLQAKGRDTDLHIGLKRVYPMKEIFAHSVGYLGQVSEEELTKEKFDLKGYSLASLLGRGGIEAQYEEVLRGREGSELVEVDTRGESVRRMGRILPTPGKILTLALDKKLQELAAKQMSGKKGGVIGLNPQNGEILILYSSPTFDPNIFLEEKSQDEAGEIIRDEENQPLFNRAISGLYPPGSIFKIVTAVAGLEERKITASSLIADPGVIEVNNFKYANWYFTNYGRTEGNINLERAIARSTDTFFYKVGEMVGPEKLKAWAEVFGVDEIFGIDLPAESAGFVGSPEWKEEVKKEQWFLGNTYHLSIGQGDVALTPLGVNLMASVVASGGKLCKPRMLRIGAENTPYSSECQLLPIEKEYLEIIKNGMIGACSAGGTGWPFFDFKITRKDTEGKTESDGRVACKTGTAETGDGQTHAWFTVFAPVENPEIVLTVLVERGGEGSSVAAPIAKEILKEYFK